jgi:hypothetical protein
LTFNKDFTPGLWDQRGFEAFVQNMNPARRGADICKVRDVFRAVAGAPLPDAAWAWARGNGQRLFVDDTCIIDAYYTPSAGVESIARRNLQHTARAAGLLVHEMIHALQDKRGQEPSLQNGFLNYYIQDAFREAQAKAFQTVATAQAELVLQGKDPGKAGSLWDGFTDWYAPIKRGKGLVTKGLGDHPDFYGALAAQYYAKLLGMPVEQTDLRFELALPPRIVRARPPQGESMEERFMAINTDFDGKPWFPKESIVRDFMEKALDPQRAARFFNGPAPTLQVVDILELDREREKLRDDCPRLFEKIAEGFLRF